jgi:hypothetical protein
MPPPVKLTNETVLARMSDTKWYTAGQITDDLRQHGSLGYEGENPDGQYRWFKYQFTNEQYQAVYNVLRRMRRAGIIDTALGDDKGNEVRVFRILTLENHDS